MHGGLALRAARVRSRASESAWAQRLRTAGTAISTAGCLPWALAVGLVAILVRLPLLFDSTPDLQPDSYGYLSIANDLSVGLTETSLVRPPGYPALIALADLLLPGSREQDVIIVQHVVGAAVPVAVLLVAWRLFGKAAAIVSALVALVSPQMIAAEHQVLSDFIFMAVVFLGVAALAISVQAQQEPPLWRLGVVGLIFGAATLVKPIGQVLVVIVPIVLLLCASRKYALRGSLVAILAMAAVVVPWIVHNYVRFDRATVSTLGDQALFWRVFDGPYRLPFAGDDAETRWVRVQYERAAAGGPPASVWLLYAKLVERGYSADEASQLQGRIAKRAILASPGRYVQSTAQYTRNFLLLAGPATSFVTHGQLSPARDRVLGSGSPVVREGARVSSWGYATGPRLLQIWWIVSLSAMAGLLLLLSRDRATRAATTALVTAWFVIALGTSLTAVSDARYSLVGMPMLWITGSAGAVLVLRAAWRAARHHGEQPT